MQHKSLILLPQGNRSACNFILKLRSHTQNKLPVTFFYVKNVINDMPISSI